MILQKYLIRKGCSICTFAKTIGRSKVLLYKYTKGTGRISERVAKEIEVASKGELKAADLLKENPPLEHIYEITGRFPEKILKLPKVHSFCLRPSERMHQMRLLQKYVF